MRSLKCFTIGITFIFVLFCSKAIAQGFSISGYVYDAVSAETLIGAYITINDTLYTTVTNNFGYYMISSKQEIKKITCHYFGYADSTISQNINSNYKIDFYLKEKELNTIVIESNIILKDKLNTAPFTITELKSVIQLGGEPDLMKALTMSPGISPAGEGLSKLIVRGGEADQNLIKLDGATIYNASHAFGFVSIFNPDAIKNVQVFKGGFPARYGGRLSSVLDFNMYEGNKKVRRGSFSIGAISSHYFLEGPLKKDTSSYMISARSSYIGIAALPLKYSFIKGSLDNYFGYWMYDLNGKVNFPSGKNGRMFLSFYTGKDFYYKVSKVYEDEIYKSNKGNGNITANVRYINTINSKLFFVAEAAYNKYKSNFLNEQFSDLFLTNFIQSTEQTSTINDINLHVALDAQIAQKIALNFGIEINPISFSPINYTTKPLDTITSVFSDSEIGNAQVWYNAAYIESIWQLSKKAELRTGVRQVLYSNQAFKQSKTEPRITFNYSPRNEYAISFSYAQMNQYVNLLTATQIGFQEEFYVPADSIISPSFSEVFSIGFNKNFYQNKYYFSLETYFKSMAGLSAIKPGVISVVNNVDQIDEITVRNGIGISYGAEVLFKKQLGDFTGWIEYTLSWNNRKYIEINNAEWFRSSYDRRHDFGITGSYKINDKWNTSVTWIYVSGQPLTIPDAIFQDPYGYYYLHFPSINNGKLPNYHRLDFAFSKHMLTKRQNESTWSFGMYNAYGRINPIYANFVLKETKDELGNVIKVETILKTETLFRFLPFITYSLKFNHERKFY